MKQKVFSINLGCFNDYHGGYINIDIRDIECDLRADIKFLPFKNEIISHIRAHNILEHISWLDTIQTLKEWFRVLRWGGKLEIRLPNFRGVVKDYLENKNIERIQGILGGQEYKENFHKSIFDEEYLKKCLISSGFSLNNLEISLSNNDIDLTLKLIK